MTDWNPKEVAKFFATAPEMPYEEDAEFRFQFQVREAHAELRVSPFNELVLVTLWITKPEECLAHWAFDCVRIRICEDEDEDEDYLAMESTTERRPGALQNSFAIAKRDDIYSIHAGSMRTPA
ncbi:hypothetical protein [Roseimicrobium sp. ORNL1]|uniref:hypothetical protein n=1 Tax=Roseimicrobium sp. ORNL1 TaxID=2711231 RepID=UPI0013E1EF83|nr:hypothetical protein [Roseimicrobium sp. ORNL1]QIF03957.1 hypothetical protein G5S37_21305 [Roseimicrobium sp. ORNL1]